MRTSRESELDADTAVAPDGEHRWAATVTPRWNIGDKPNGGYAMAIIARAMLAEAAHPDLLVISAYFLSPPDTGPATVVVEPLRLGRGVSTLAARLVQDGRERLHALATIGDLEAASGPTVVSALPPPLPPPELCVATDPRSERDTPFMFDERLDTRFDPAGGEPGVAEVNAWVRLADGREPDALALLVITDGLPPAVMNLGVDGWIPTLELTVHVRARPAPGWLRSRTVTRALVDGYLEEDAEVWDAGGRLVAQSRQLARAGR